MADTNHAHPAGMGPVQEDGVDYRGIIWFLAIMAAVAIVCEVLMFGTFKWLDRQVAANDTSRPPLAVPAGRTPPAPNLLYEASGSPAQNEPGYLEQFRGREDAILNGYALDKASGTARIPIEKAKALLLERGLPTRDTSQPAETKKEE